MTQLQPHKDIYAIPVPLEAKDYDFVNSRTKHLTFTSRGVNLTIAMDVPTLDKYDILGEVTKDSIFLEDYLYWLDKKNGDLLIYFHSLLAANGLFFENPMGKKLKVHVRCIDEAAERERQKLNHEIRDRWQSYEDKLIQKALIIKKNDVAKTPNNS